MLAGFATFGALVALLVLVAMPLLTLAHELGHALVAAALVGGRVVVVQGPAPARVRLSVGRLELRLRGAVPPHKAMVGWALWGPHPDPWRHAAATLAGPLASAGCMGAAVASAAVTRGDALAFSILVAFAAALQTASTGLPVRYGRWFGGYAGEASDGLRVRQLLRGTPEPAPTLV